MNPLEQAPKAMSTEQIPLDFGDHEEQLQPAVPETKEVALETLDEEALELLYHEAVGKDPKVRTLDREQLIAGIRDPKAELKRLGVIDRASDKDDQRRTYVR